MDTSDGGLEVNTISALLSYSKQTRHSNIQEILPEFYTPLKTNFENRNLWLRFALSLSLSRESPHSSLQAFNECMRIDQNDPLPAMLAAKIFLMELNDPCQGLIVIKEAIKRCRNIADGRANEFTSCGKEHLQEPSANRKNDSSHTNQVYKYDSSNIGPILAKCYLLASVMHAHAHERELESIRQLKQSELEASLYYLELAGSTYSEDYLTHFHRALHHARQRSFQKAIDKLRLAIRLNPHHVPSNQLLILSLTATKRYQEALELCESTLLEFEDNLLLLYIKCSIEAKKKGFKAAFHTAQCMLKQIRQSRKSDELKTNECAKHTNLIANDSGQYGDDVLNLDKLDLKSGELFVWLLVAEMFLMTGSTKDAELCVDEGSAHASGALSHNIMFIRGLIAKANGSLNEAKNFFQSCLALCPRHPKALQQLAHIHYLLGNYPVSEKFLRDSLDSDSNAHESWQYLSLVYIEMNHHSKATECANKATELEEQSPVVSISSIPRLVLD